MSTSKDRDIERTRVLIDPEEVVEHAASQILESALSEDVFVEDDEVDAYHIRAHRLHNGTLRWHEKPNVYAISFILLLMSTSFAIPISSRIDLLLKLMCRYAGSSVESCHDSRIQELVSFVQSLSVFTVGFISTLISGKIGELSDRFGRKPILITISIFAIANKLWLIFIFSPTATYHLSFIIIASVLEAGNNFILILSVITSYITDVSEPDKRVVNLGFSTGSLYAGLGIGPLIGSYIIKWTHSTMSTLYADLGISLVTFISILILKESRSSVLRRRSQSFHLQRKQSFVLQQASQPTRIPLWRLYDVIKPLKRLWLPKHKTLGYIPRYNLLILIYIDTILGMVGGSLLTPLILYTTYVFQWTPEIIGYYISTYGLSKCLTLYLITPLVTHIFRKHFKTNDKKLDYADFSIILLGAFLETVYPLLVLLANNSAHVFIAAVFGAIGTIASPAVQASIVKYVPESKIGEVFGAIALIKNLLAMVGPTSFLYVYSRSVKFAPKLVFVLAFGFIASAAFSSLFLRVNNDSELINDVDTESTAESENLFQSGNSSPKSVVRAPSFSRSQYGSFDSSNGRVSFGRNSS